MKIDWLSLACLFVSVALVRPAVGQRLDGIRLLDVSSADRAALATAAAAPTWNAASRSRPRFVTGFNQAWLADHYGSQWVTRWDEAEARRMIEGTRELGGRILRMWLFEGVNPEGVVWDDDPTLTPGPRHRTRPTGIDPRKLAHVERFMQLADEAGVKIYWTLFDGNIYDFVSGPNAQARKNEWWNVLNDRFGAGPAFRQNVLAPVLAVLARHPTSVFGLDLVNEVNALVKNHWFADGWVGARLFVSRWRDFVRERVSVPVTASFGHHDAVSCLLDGRLPDTLVDFYDVHAYDDRAGLYAAPVVARFCQMSSRPVYLGEFGQEAARFDDDLQTRVTERYLRNARGWGLAGALAWRLSDIRPGHNAQARHSYEAFGRWRPAASRFREVSAELTTP